MYGVSQNNYVGGSGGAGGIQPNSGNRQSHMPITHQPASLRIISADLIRIDNMQGIGPRPGVGISPFCALLTPQAESSVRAMSQWDLVQTPQANSLAAHIVIRLADYSAALMLDSEGGGRSRLYQLDTAEFQERYGQSFRNFILQYHPLPLQSLPQPQGPAPLRLALPSDFRAHVGGDVENLYMQNFTARDLTKLARVNKENNTLVKGLFPQPQTGIMFRGQEHLTFFPPEQRLRHLLDGNDTGMRNWALGITAQWVNEQPWYGDSIRKALLQLNAYKPVVTGTSPSRSVTLPEAFRAALSNTSRDTQILAWQTLTLFGRQQNPPLSGNEIATMLTTNSIHPQPVVTLSQENQAWLDQWATELATKGVTADLSNEYVGVARQFLENMEYRGAHSGNRQDGRIVDQHNQPVRSLDALLQTGKVSNAINSYRNYLGTELAIPRSYSPNLHPLDVFDYFVRGIRLQQGIR